MSWGKNRACIAICAVLFMTGCQTTSPPKATLTAQDAGTISYAISRPYKGKAINGTGQLEFPETGKSKYPLVVLVHGTAGVGKRERAWGEYLRSQGVATFIVDYFGPRGATSSSRDVPRPPEDVLGALKQLSKHPKIDTGNVAVMGFSNGASVAALSANYVPEKDTNGVKPKAYIMVYGGCHVGANNMYFASGTEPAVLFIAAEEDSLVSLSNCKAAGKNYQIKNSRTFVVPGAEHGFDSFKNVTFNHPRWGVVTMRHDGAAMNLARQEVTKLLRETFATGSM